MPRVLLAEDDPVIAEPLSRALAREGYEVAVADSGAGAVERAPDFDLLILDLNLSGENGSEVARQVRARGLSVPILVLSGRADELSGLNGAGTVADDYVTKPFRLADLLARARKLLSGGHSSGTGEVLRAQDIEVDTKLRRATKGETELHLTNKEFDLLATLIRQAGTVIPQEVLCQDLWGNDPQGSPKTLETHVSWLRRKLADDAAEPQYITTDPEVGYKFENGNA
ncbi:MAG: response regulator transcription factor [Promicromonosporaceae bacterium]|nr:response regulator transcription factor [Promicromonosporaceae bacterium]